MTALPQRRDYIRRLPILARLSGIEYLFGAGHVEHSTERTLFIAKRQEYGPARTRRTRMRQNLTLLYRRTAMPLLPSDC